MFCENCGQENPEGTRFCAGCGQVVSGSAAAMASASEAARRLRSAAATAAQSPTARSSASLFSSVFGNFNAMVTPKLITLVFWILILAVLLNGLIFGLLGGVVMLVKSSSDESAGLALLYIFGSVLFTLLGIMATRIFCEFMIVQFKIHEALQDIRAQASKS